MARLDPSPLPKECRVVHSPSRPRCLGKQSFYDEIATSKKKQPFSSPSWLFEKYLPLGTRTEETEKAQKLLCHALLHPEIIN